MLPTFDVYPELIGKAKVTLNSCIDEFLRNRTSMFLNYEAGAGKTNQAIEALVKLLMVERFAKVAIFAPTHELGEQIEQIEQIEQDIKDILSGFRGDSLREMLTNVRVKNISGRGKLCIHPLQIKFNETNDKNIETILKNDMSRICRDCQDSDICKYVSQFNEYHTQVRIYTHDALFNQPSFRDYGWVPDYLIVDEDVINHHILDSDLVQKYNSQHSPVIGAIIADVENNGMTIQQSLLQHFDNIRVENAQYNKALRDWNKRKIDAGTNVKLLSNVLNDKPKILDVLKVLLSYTKLLLIHVNPEQLHNPRIYVEKGQLIYAPRKEIHQRHKDIPKLFLDASADETVARQALGDDIQFKSIRVKYQDGVKVTQIENKGLSRNQMKDCKTIDNIVDYIISESGGKTFGIISYQFIHEKLAKRTNAVISGYFGNIRGYNNFENLDILFVVGNHQIPSYALEAKYRQLFGDITLHPSFGDCFQNIKYQKVFRMKDGVHRSVTGFRYSDDRVEALFNHINRAETYQASHRLRLIHGDRVKHLHIMTSDVQDITVDNLVNTIDIFGIEHENTSNRIREIVDAISDMKYWEISKNKPLLERLHTVTEQQLKTLKKNESFIERLTKNDQIRYIEVKGVVSRGKKTITKKFLMSADYIYDAADMGFVNIDDLRGL